MFGEFILFGDTNIMFQKQKYESMETLTKIGEIIRIIEDFYEGWRQEYESFKTSLQIADKNMKVIYED